MYSFLFLGSKARLMPKTAHKDSLGLYRLKLIVQSQFHIKMVRD